MAELEVSKHAKNAWKTAFSQNHGFWHKLREILLEIFIIVFAVSLSIWMHEQGEHRHEQKQVKEFLLELKTDLQSDIGQTEEIIQFHHKEDALYSYLGALNPQRLEDPEKFKNGFEHAVMWTNYFLQPHLSKYDGFKSSGKLTNIENAILLNHIVNLYEESIPQIKSSETGWKRSQDELIEYLNMALDTPAESGLQLKYITDPKGKRLTKSLITPPQFYHRYQNFIDLGNKIIKEIDLTYPGISAGVLESEK